MAKVGYVGNTPNSSSVIIARQIYNVSASVGLVTFTSTYQPGYVDVYLNGVRLVDVVDYSAADGTHINLSTDAVVGDVIEAVSYKAFNVTDKRIGISSDGILIGTVDALNFVGAGHTFVTNGSSINCSITGPQGAPGVGRTWATYDGLTGVTTSKKVRISNNLEVSGVTTSTGGFVGALTGNSTGLTGSPNITVGTIGCGNVTSTGSITGATGSFSGNVTIGGVLTYEDVTNIDSIGIITARSGVSIGDSIFHTGDSNTAIRFPAVDTFTVETAGSEALRIDSSQRLLKGHTTSEGMLYTGGIQVQGTNSSTSAITIKTNQNDSGGPALVLGKSRGSLGGTTVVQSGDQLGSVYFNGADGTDTNTPAAEIRCSVDGTPGANDMPGRIEFHTTADGAASSTERLRITSDGKFGFKTTSPDYTVDINGEVGITEGQPVTWHNGSGSPSAQIFGDSSDNLIFRNTSSGVERLRITSAGQVQATGPGSSGSVISSKVTTNNGGYLAYEGIASNGTTTFSVNHNGDIASAGTVSDSIGPLRRLGIHAGAGVNISLTAGHAGYLSRMTAGGTTVTVPVDTLTAGDMCSVFNVSTGNVSIAPAGGVTMYNSADGSTGTRTLAAKGLVTILCSGTNEFIITGTGLS